VESAAELGKRRIGNLVVGAAAVAVVFWLWPVGFRGKGAVGLYREVERAVIGGGGGGADR
jgi:hypothetical protein